VVDQKEVGSYVRDHGGVTSNGISVPDLSARFLPPIADMRRMTAVEDRNVEFVRLLWSTTHRAGITPALRLADPDIEWSLHFVPGRIFDTEELRVFLTKLQGERQLLAAYLLRVRSKGDVVLASGSFRWGSIDGGLSDFQGHWVYWFKRGRLASGRSFRTLGEASEAFNAVDDRSRSAFPAE
jgi:hypothetical protein